MIPERRETKPSSLTELMRQRFESKEGKAAVTKAVLARIAYWTGRNCHDKELQKSA